MSLTNYAIKRQPKLIRGKPPDLQAQQRAWFDERMEQLRKWGFAPEVLQEQQIPRKVTGTAPLPDVSDNGLPPAHEVTASPRENGNTDEGSMGIDESTVVIVVDPEFDEGVVDVLRENPAWVVDTPANRALWDSTPHIEKNSALFYAANPQQRLPNLLAVLPDIEDHFGPDSYPSRPYHCIHVIGLVLTDEVEKELHDRGFANFRQTGDGFKADFKRE